MIKVPSNLSFAKWIIFWTFFVISLIAIDVFYFKPNEGVRNRAVIEIPESVSEETMAVKWLGPPYFSSAREDLWVENFLEDTFNFEITPIFLDANAYQRKKPLMIAGGNVPDVIWEGDPISLQKAVEHRFVAEVPYEVVFAAMPNYARYVTENVPIAWTYSSVDNQNFGIPTINPSGALPVPGVWRMDWLRNVGIEHAPKTLVEFEEALRRIRYDDPDRNGIDDTYGMSGDISNWWWVAFSEIFGAYGVLPFDFQLVGDTVVWGGVRPETKEVLALLNRWYEDGLIHPDFVTDNASVNQTLDRKFYTGKIGYIYYRGKSSNMNPVISNGFYNSFLNLQFVSVVGTNKEFFDPAVEAIPSAVVHYLVAKQIIDEFDAIFESIKQPIHVLVESEMIEKGIAEDLITSTLAEIDNYSGFNETIKKWILSYAFSSSLIDKSFDEPSGIEIKDDLIEEMNAENWMVYATAKVLHGYVFDRLSSQEFTEISNLVAQELQQKVTDIGLGEAIYSYDIEERRRFVELLDSGELDFLIDVVYEKLKEIQLAPSETEEQALLALLINHFQKSLRDELMTPLLLTAPFPEGPDGHKGARIWGKAGNIITFGKHVAEDPSKAIRIMKMLDSLFSDQTLYIESLTGREGVHWEWGNPVEKQLGKEGISLKADYVDPVSGEVIDLTAGLNGFRNMLDVSLGFYNVVSGKKEFNTAYKSKASVLYEENYQPEELGLVNVLGKSDVVPSASKYLSDLRMQQQTLFAEIIRGSKPLSAFDDFIEQWNSKGGVILEAEAADAYAKQVSIINRLQGIINE